MKNLIDLIRILINRDIKINIKNDGVLCDVLSYTSTIYGWSYVLLLKDGWKRELFIHRNMTADDFFNCYKGGKLLFYDDDLSLKSVKIPEDEIEWEILKASVK
jgi:hypothetical protein